ncbi:MAG: pyruvoyl-dependent arginine decarboxylase [bacterium]
MNLIPTQVFLTKGVGIHRDKLQSFELALRDAKIEKCNLVRVSSIFPPGCKIISRNQGIKLLQPGQITFCVMSDNVTNEPNRLIAASVGLAIPADITQHGYLSEHHAFGQTGDDAGDYAEDLAACMLATTLGIEFDAEVHWDARKEVWKMSRKIVHTRNVTQSAEGHKDGLWTTVVAVAVLLP